MKKGVDPTVDVLFVIHTAYFIHRTVCNFITFGVRISSSVIWI
jgi:hypothetical protein